MDIKLLKREKKEALSHEEKTPFQESLKLANEFLFAVAEISLEDKLESKKILPLLGNNDADKSPNVSNSKMGGLNDTAPEMEEQIDEDFAFVDDDIWQRLVNPWTLFFRSHKREEIYFRTVLLPNRVLLTRLASSTLFILLLVNIHILDSNTLGPSVWAITIVLSFIFSVLTWVDKGKYYVDLCLESSTQRFGVMLGEVLIYLIFFAKKNSYA
jgi:hypothetical protein